MLERLSECAEGAIHRLAEHASVIGIRNIDEFTFRAFLAYELASRNSGLRVETEWNKIDLAIMHDEHRCVVELKFYINRPRFDASCEQTRYWKGGPKAQNRTEFIKCVNKLRNADLPKGWGRYLLLAYEPNLASGRPGYERYYSPSCSFEGVSQRIRVPCPPTLPMNCAIYCVDPARHDHFAT